MSIISFDSRLLFPNSAQPGLEYLYTRNKFSWNQPDFAEYIALFSLVQVLGNSFLCFHLVTRNYISSAHSGMLLVLPLLSSYLGLPDSVIGILSLVGNICSYMLLAFSTSSRMVYLCNT